MKRLVFLVFVVFAAWYGWHHYQDLLRKTPKNEAVIVNHTGEVLTRVRLTVDGQTFVKEEMANDESASFTFGVNRDSRLDLIWDYAAKTNEGHWTGGGVVAGPSVSRHTITVRPDGGVIYETSEL